LSWFDVRVPTQKSADHQDADTKHVEGLHAT
jgi:hypothetical protein